MPRPKTTEDECHSTGLVNERIVSLLKASRKQIRGSKIRIIVKGMA